MSRSATYGSVGRDASPNGRCAPENAADEHARIDRSRHAVHWARRMLAPERSVVVDVETTSLKGSIIEVSVADPGSGELLLDTLVAPPDGVSIDPESYAVHGINPATLVGAPTLPQIWNTLCEIAAGKTLLAYHSGFEAERFRSDADVWGLTGRPADLQAWECLMKARSAREGTTRRLKLGTTYHHHEDGPPHRSAADTLAATRLLHELATEPAWWPSTPAFQNTASDANLNLRSA